MMYDDAGARVEVPHCHTNEAHRTLGVMLAPDDNNKGQVADDEHSSEIWRQRPGWLHSRI